VKLLMSDAGEAQDFYNNIQEAQQYILNDVAFCDLSGHLIQLESQGETDRTRVHSATLKRYYTCQLFLSSRRFDDHYSAFRSSANSAPPSQPPLSASPLANIASFRTVCQTAQDPAQIDILTFSTIPSAYRFFLLYDDYKSFIKLMKNLFPLSTAPSFFRLLFVTPHFLNFVRKTIAPILAKDVQNGRLRLLADFFSAVFASWKEHANVCPTFFRDIRARLANPTDRTDAMDGRWHSLLRDCFWTPFFRSPHQFLGCEPDFVIPDGFFPPDCFDFRLLSLPELWKNLWQVPNDCLSCLPSDTPSPERFAVAVYDGFDTRATSTPFVVNQVSFDLIFVDNGGAVPVRSLAQTNVNDPRILIVRRMLKNGPRLPRGLIVAAGSTPLDILRQHLVLAAPRASRPRVTALYDTLRLLLCERPNARERAGWHLKVPQIEHNELMEQLVEMRNHDLVNAWRAVADRATAAIPFLLHSRLLGALIGGGFLGKQNPREFYDCLGRLVSKSANLLPPFRNPEVCYHLLARSLDFGAYRRASGRLQQLDSLFVLMHREMALNPPSESPVLPAHVPYYDQFRARFVQIWTENCDPLTKAMHLVEFHEEFVKTHVRQCGGSAEPDPILDLWTWFMPRVNPPAFVSTFAYLIDFLFRAGHDDAVMFAQRANPHGKPTGMLHVREILTVCFLGVCRAARLRIPLSGVARWFTVELAVTVYGDAGLAGNFFKLLGATAAGDQWRTSVDVDDFRLRVTAAPHRLDLLGRRQARADILLYFAKDAEGERGLRDWWEKSSGVFHMVFAGRTVAPLLRGAKGRDLIVAMMPADAAASVRAMGRCHDKYLRHLEAERSG
jgi:hypothetical protein